MPTIDELSKKYSKMTDKELYDIYINREGFSAVAKEALRITLDKRDGFDEMINNFELISNKDAERKKLYEAALIYHQKDEKYEEFLKKHPMKYLADSEINEVVLLAEGQVKKFKEDEKIGAKTIIGGITGGLIGGSIGGVILGVQLIRTGRIIYFVIAGLAFISYTFIKLFTKQSKNNIAVLIITILSVLFAILLGTFIFKIIGYQGI